MACCQRPSCRSIPGSSERCCPTAPRKVCSASRRRACGCRWRSRSGSGCSSSIAWSSNRSPSRSKNRSGPTPEYEIAGGLERITSLPGRKLGQRGSSRLRPILRKSRHFLHSPFPVHQLQDLLGRHPIEGAVLEDCRDLRPLGGAEAGQGEQQWQGELALLEVRQHRL